MNKMIWYGNGGHFCGLPECQFHLCTEVNGYLISTVGEYYPDGYKKGRGMVELTLAKDSFYETMVFHMTGSRCGCGCGLPDVNLSAIEQINYKTPKEANENHIKLCRKYQRMKKDE